MIISRTPLRISLVGGGTDFEEFYRAETGAVISTAIDTDIYVTVNRRIDDLIRVSYSKTEIVDDVEALQHELIREALTLTGTTRGVEVTTIAEIPGKGTGLASSSALTVGVLHALYAYQGMTVTPERLAREAYHIEHEILRQPIGKQDQYIAAYGGLRRLDFAPGGDVGVTSVDLPSERRHALEERLLLFFTGITRSASSVLHDQRARVEENRHVLRELKQLVDELERCLRDGGPLDHVGEILHQGWSLKQRLSDSIAGNGLATLYARARAAGALGGKIAGAGAGGCLLLYCPPEHQPAVRQSLADLREIPFHFESEGSKIVYDGR